MKLADLTEAKYAGNELSQREREQLAHDIYDLIPKADHDRHDREDPEIYNDDWRVVISFSTVDYYEVLERMTDKFGEPTLINGYSEGTYKEGFIPSWKIKDHQIQYKSGYGDVNIEISKV